MSNGEIPQEYQLEADGSDVMIARARKMLGQDFLGARAVLQMGSKLRAVGINVEFDVTNNPPLPFSEVDLALAKENEEMLVLRTAEMKLDGILMPVSLINFRELFKKDPRNEGQRLFYFEGSDPNDWYANETFATSASEIRPGWALVKKEVLIDSTDKDWNQQDHSLRTYSESLRRNGGLQTVARRRTAAEAVWDTMLNYVNNGKQASDNYDWTQTLASDGRFVYVGEYRSRGLEVNGYAPIYSAPYLGIRSSR